jgi:hypothetical protein
MCLIGLFNGQSAANNRDFSITIITTDQMGSYAADIIPYEGLFDTEKY